MQSFLNLWSGMLSDLSEFLLSEPVCYFVGGLFLLMVISLVRAIIR